MYVRKIILNNYRIYYGKNELEFLPDGNRNIFLVSGENGFGKTTFLTALVWCLYGKLIADVDEKYKQEISEMGGYKKYTSRNLNRLAAAQSVSSYSVSIVLSDISISSVPCQEVQITRTYVHSGNYGDDHTEILIDGQKNELTKEVGADIFINDFILPKEVAKFFFFDAEKIVSLAEMKSIEDKRKLSKAYAEVLGIKKYEALRNNLQDLCIRFRRNSATKKEKERFEILQEEITDIQRLITCNQEKITQLDEEKTSKKWQSEQYQESLIREGNSLTVSELINLKKERDRLSEYSKQIRSRMKDLLELAPFAISGNRFMEARTQMHKESKFSLNKINPSLIKERIKKVKSKLPSLLGALHIGDNVRSQLVKDVAACISDEFMFEKKDNYNILLDFSKTECNEFEAIYTYLKTSYSTIFKQLIQEEKRNRFVFNKIIRKITNAESKENDLLIQKIRNKKTDLDNRIAEIEIHIDSLHQEIGGLQRDAAVKSRQLSDLSKKIEIEASDQEKNKLAKHLIERLEDFIFNLKTQKKVELEKRIKKSLNQLMHKTNFIYRVEVEVGSNIIDIQLYDNRNNLILKESLSKGEQQLYATSILKALVDESNVQFPIFVDSPLQKFDKHHSRNIICEFYPNISNQVILFPLLEKELTETEYKMLLPKIGKIYLIKNLDEDRSIFQQINHDELFKNVLN